MNAVRPLGLYIHIPFCKAKCAYCDFFSLAHSEAQMDAYCAALGRDLVRRADAAAAYTVDTVYFGGGTPSCYGAERIVVELNGMHTASDFYLKTPDDWMIAQEVMFADSNTIMAYNANMRQLVYDKLAGAEMVVFNRMTPGADVMPYHELARAVNRKIDILYDYLKNSEYDLDELQTKPLVEMTKRELAEYAAKLEKEMKQAAADLQFERAAELRDRIFEYKVRL